MTDNELVARLREWDHCWPARWLDTAVPQAADAIERLTRERDEARSRFNDIDLCRMAQSPCNALLDAETRIAELTRERDEARGGREVRHRAWLEAKARIAELITLIADVRAMALEDAAKVAEAPTDKPARCREDIAAAIRALKEPTHD